MSNTSKGRGVKGSKFWMQMIPNTGLKEEFDKIIGEELEWLSPLEGEEILYEEYELGAKEMITELGITDVSIFDFWPKRQPQWDGIALSKDKKTLYIVEAKAHISEIDSKCSASEESKQIIEKAMQEVHDDKYPAEKFFPWMNDYYQLGNRLTFLQKMKEKLPESNSIGIKDVKLVLINFTDDFTFKSEPVEVWKDHYREVFEKMTGNEDAPEDVINIFYSVKPMGNQ